MTAPDIVSLHIRSRRPLTGRSQRECADIAQVSQALWSKWESGDRCPPLDKLDVIALLCNCTILDMLTPPPRRAATINVDRDRDDKPANDPSSEAA